MRSGAVVLGRISGFMVRPVLFPRYVDFGIAGPEETKNLAGENVLRLIQIRLATPSFEKISPVSQDRNDACRKTR